MRNLQLAITDFAIPSPRLGHIEQFSGYGGLPNIGAELHLLVQAERARLHPGYTAERWVTHAFPYGDAKITVSGRADGFCFGQPTLIEEIKSAYNVPGLRAALDQNPHHPYLLQLRTYGYLHYLSYGSEPMLNLLVVNARTREVEERPIALDVPDYEAWLHRRLSELAEQQTTFEAGRKRRKKEAARFTFPFVEARPGQRELMTLVEDNLKPDRRVLVQAPTGLGKTAGVLVPTLKEAMARGQKAIYLTAKNSQFEVAEDAARRLQESGVKVRTLTLHAKTKMCLKDEVSCNPAYCEFARDHYTKLSEGRVVEAARKKKRLTAEAIRKLARRHEVCPFELQMESVAHADLIICDYNYVFSPRNSVGRLTFNGFAGQTKANAANLIIDEVHNLPQRANEYFSATLSAEALADLVDQMPESVRAAGDDLLDTLRRLLVDVGENAFKPRRIELGLERVLPVVGKAEALMSRYLEGTDELVPADPVVRAVNLVTDFAGALEALDEAFLVTWSPGYHGGNLRVTCCDASKWLRESHQQFNAVVGFSATLKPFAYYAQLTGLDGEHLVTAEFESPFPPDHRKVLVIPQVSTKMRDRAANYQKIAEAVERLVGLKPGNYFVFFPSFDFLAQVLARTRLPDFRVVEQKRDTRREQVTETLALLREAVPTVVFAVQGGVYAEGVDYPGEMLIGALIVGPALPTFDFERELLREYYDKRHGRGFDYAYTYPAMARVVQSAGRVIRSATDRGLIVLLDRRFTEPAYRNAMPRDWLAHGELTSRQILSDVARFWDDQGEAR